jgi:hypothetical protein
MHSPFCRLQVCGAMFIARVLSCSVVVTMMRFCGNTFGIYLRTETFGSSCSSDYPLCRLYLDRSVKLWKPFAPTIIMNCVAHSNGGPTWSFRALLAQPNEVTQVRLGSWHELVLLRRSESHERGGKYLPLKCRAAVAPPGPPATCTPIAPTVCRGGRLVGGFGTGRCGGGGAAGRPRTQRARMDARTRLGGRRTQVTVVGRPAGPLARPGPRGARDSRAASLSASLRLEVDSLPPPPRASARSGRVPTGCSSHSPPRFPRPIRQSRPLERPSLSAATNAMPMPD